MDFDSLLLTQSKAEARSAWFQLPMTPILQNDTGLKVPDDSTISALLCCGEALSRLQLSGGFYSLCWGAGGEVGGPMSHHKQGDE